jgi:hypothetical protein
MGWEDGRAGGWRIPLARAWRRPQTRTRSCSLQQMSTPDAARRVGREAGDARWVLAVWEMQAAEERIMAAQWRELEGQLEGHTGTEAPAASVPPRACELRSGHWQEAPLFRLQGTGRRSVVGWASLTSLRKGNCAGMN